MRTVRCSGRLRGGGVSEVSAQGGCLPRGIHPPVNRMTRVKHNLSATTVADGNNKAF